MLASNAELARKLAAMEKKYDDQFKVVFEAIRQLMSPAAKLKREPDSTPRRMMADGRQKELGSTSKKR